MNTTVFNLDTYTEQSYSCGPREAVIAAYAQSRNDWNTWNYENWYGSQVKLIKDRTWVLGDFTAVNR